jgi:hypothetical protein
MSEENGAKLPALSLHYMSRGEKKAVFPGEKNPPSKKERDSLAANQKRDCNQRAILRLSQAFLS